MSHMHKWGLGASCRAVILIVNSVEKIGVPAVYDVLYMYDTQRLEGVVKTGDMYYRISCVHHNCCLLPAILVIINVSV